MRARIAPAAAAVLGAGVIAAAARYRTRTPLEGRTVVITGGSRGLGLALAYEFAGRGARIAIGARDEAELAEAEAGLRDGGAEVLTERCDVADPQQARRLIDRAADRFGPVDVLVNNAGNVLVGALESLTLDDFHQAMDVMCWGMVNTTLAVLPEMRERRSGHIVNITSIGGKIAAPHLMPYNTAKFAAVGFSESLHAEARPYGVRVTTVVPGLMRTGSDVQARFAGDATREYTWFAAGAAAPVLSMDGRIAARRIVNAVRIGRTEVVLTPAAKLAVRAHGLAPSLTQATMTAADRLLPDSSGARGQERGFDVARSRTGLKRLTDLNRRAGRKLNQPEPT